MMVRVRNVLWAVGIVFSYPLYSLGQIALFISKQKEADFYDLLNKYPAEWINAHLILLLSLLLLIPAFLGLNAYFKKTKSSVFIQISTLFTVLLVFVLFGQFTIDLSLIDLFKLPKGTAYQLLDTIQNDPVIKPLFYDNSKLFFLFKYVDFSFLGQIFLGIALLMSNKIPKWAKGLFFIALVLTQLGILIHPYYGRIIKRLSYSLISVSLLPVAAAILRMDTERNKG